jgi:hypothetical protein
MRTVGLLVGVLASIALGAAVVVAAQVATREPQQGWVVAVGGDSFVVLDQQGAPEEVCGVELGETHCHPVQRDTDLYRRPVERGRWSDDDAAGLVDTPQGA